MHFPVELVPRASRLMMAGLAAGHLVLAAAFLASSLPPFIIGLSLLALLLAAALSFRRWRRMASLRFVLGQEGAIQVIPPLGPAYEVRAGRNCRDLGWAVWLAWDGPEGGHQGEAGILMLPRDALTPDAWRTLRVWLKFHSGLGETA